MAVIFLVAIPAALALIGQAEFMLQLRQGFADVFSSRVTLPAMLIGGLYAFLKYSRFGVWIRATTQDRIMASAMGVPVPLVHTAVFAIGAAMAAASGVLFGPIAGVTQNMGFDFTLRAFIVVVVGGMGNLGGSILAAIFISLLEAYASLIVSPAQAVIVSFVVLTLTLQFRPTGLFLPTPT